MFVCVCMYVHVGVCVSVCVLVCVCAVCALQPFTFLIKSLPRSVTPVSPCNIRLLYCERTGVNHLRVSSIFLPLFLSLSHCPSLSDFLLFLTFNPCLTRTLFSLFSHSLPLFSLLLLFLSPSPLSLSFSLPPLPFSLLSLCLYSFSSPFLSPSLPCCFLA